MHKTVLAAAFALALGTTAASAANIVETAKQAGSFNTLLAAATAAGLADALATTPNITVFAPTDEAFAKLPAGTVENLLKPENKDQLVAILTYHVLPRKLASNQMLAGPFHVRTLKATPDRTLAITKNADGVTVDNARVVKADIIADNGIIHVIDAVMLPSK
ncbi:MAG: fasciclin domain-containing protein [Aestuariivirga sp.]|uniref:fasciclin domain-containing protein n=1 Tax=Aestuariivirga sp. TaxID=2650926 RepID=UPI0038CFF253